MKKRVLTSVVVISSNSKKVNKRAVMVSAPNRNVTQSDIILRISNLKAA